MTTATRPEVLVHLRRPWEPTQAEFVNSLAKRIIIRAGRRGGKTTGIAIRAVRRFLAGRRVLYAAPTQEQVDAFWWEVKKALAEPLDAGVFYKNESLHLIELPDTKQRIRAKTAWSADTLRGDFADDLILDEWQLMNEDAWELVGAPMLLDNDGDAVFIYTPPSLHSRSVTKAKDPRHAAYLYKRALQDTTGRWAAFHFTSRANPHISTAALESLTQDMTGVAIRQEIEAEDIDEAPGALWTRQTLERTRVRRLDVTLNRVLVGVDPPGSVGTECGIVVAGLGGDGHVYIVDDRSLHASPDGWARAVIGAYQDQKADRIVGEQNYGGDMVEATIRRVGEALGIPVSYSAVTATRGKAVRAEPVAALYERGRIHHLGTFPALEDELTMWAPGEGQRSPNRLDALVWACTPLLDGVRRSESMDPLGIQTRGRADNPLGLDMSKARYQDRDRRDW